LFASILEILGQEEKDNQEQVDYLEIINNLQLELASPPPRKKTAPAFGLAPPSSR